MKKLLILTMLISSLSFAQTSKYDLIYTSTETGNPEIFVRSMDGKEKVQLTNYDLRDGYSALSPDGKTIAFYAYYDEGKTWCIHTMDLDGKNRKRLTYKKGIQDAAPQWSPDGKQIIFSRRENMNYLVMLMNADGSNLRQLDFPFALHPNFTPDYKVVFSTHWESNGEICIADATGKNIVQLTYNEAADGHPSISPDGKKIAFYSERDGNKEIYTMNIDGTNQKRLTFNEANEWSPTWSPDGSQIAFISNRKGYYQIYVINADGSGLKNISNSEFRESSPCWIP